MSNPPDTGLTGEDHELHIAVSHNITVSVLTNSLYLVSRLFLPPFILHYVSLEEYGLWSYCFILIGYFAMSAFGITNVYVRYAAVYAAKGEMEQINRLISTGILSTLFASGITLLLIWFCLPFFIDLFNVPPELHTTAFILIIGTVSIFMLDLSIGAFNYLLQSMQRFVAEKIIWTISYMLETVLIVLLLLAGFGIYSLLWAFIIRILVSIILYAIACYRVLPELSIRCKFFDPSMLKLFYRFGGIVQLSGLLAILNRSLEKVFAGSFISLAATALFEIGEKFPVMSLLLPGSITAVFLPTTAHLHAKERQDKIFEIYVKGSRLINLLTGLMMGFMASFALPMITCWLGNDSKYQIAATIMTFFTFAYQMDVLTGPASAIYRSINQPAKELLYGFLQLILVCLATFIGFYFWGYTMMVIIVGVSSMMVLAALIYIVFNNRNFNVTQSQYLKTILIPGFIPYICGALIAWSSSFWYTETVAAYRLYVFIYLVICFSLYLAIVSSIIYFLLLNQNERKYLRAYVTSLTH